MVKRREISEKIIQEQMKRKRQTKKIEERLAKLIPLINEANSMAEELKKPVRFEARLSVKSSNVNLSTLDELRNLKTIDVTIRVTSLENGNVWNWSVLFLDAPQRAVSRLSAQPLQSSIALFSIYLTPLSVCLCSSLALAPALALASLGTT